MSVENKKELVWWSSPFNELIRTWLKNNNPDVLDDFENLEFLEKTVWISVGYNSRSYPITGLADRKHETQFMYNQTPDSVWIPYQEYPKQSFADCMFDAARSIADEGKTIDLFWSGGLDSTAILIAFNELGLHKQLRLIIGGEIEEPAINLFNKIVKDRMDYVITDTFLLNELLGLAKPDEHIWTGGAIADSLFGCRSQLYGRGIDIENTIELWNNKRQYYHTGRLFRTISHCDLDWIDINNHKTFYAHPSIEKFTINHTLSGEMVFYDVLDAGWDNLNEPGVTQWFRTAGYGENCSRKQEHYLTCKLPMREFIYNFTKDDSISYKMPKVVSELKMKFERQLNPSANYVHRPQPPLRNIAITSEGLVITRDNFLDHDWLDYINTQN